MNRLALLAILPLLLSGASPQENTLGEASRYRILYAGKPGDPREAQFVELLKSRFTHVKSIDLNQLSSASAKDFDVIVADWTRRYGGKGEFKSDRQPRLALNGDFAKPIVMIGAVGGEIQQHTKLDWL